MSDDSDEDYDVGAPAVTPFGPERTEHIYWILKVFVYGSLLSFFGEIQCHCFNLWDNEAGLKYIKNYGFFTLIPITFSLFSFMSWSFYFNEINKSKTVRAFLIVLTIEMGAFVSFLPVVVVGGHSKRSLLQAAYITFGIFLLALTTALCSPNADEKDNRRLSTITTRTYLVSSLIVLIAATAKKEFRVMTTSLTIIILVWVLIFLIFARTIGSFAYYKNNINKLWMLTAICYYIVCGIYVSCCFIAYNIKIAHEFYATEREGWGISS